MKVAELRAKSSNDLKQELHSLLRKQFKARLQSLSDEGVKPHLVKAMRKTVARIKMVLAEQAKSASKS